MLGRTLAKSSAEPLGGTPNSAREQIYERTRFLFASAHDERDDPIEHKMTRAHVLLTTLGESRFDDRECANFLRQRSAVSGTGLSVSGLQSAAHRQLVGSIVVLAMIAVVSALIVLMALMALQPVHREATNAPAHRFAVVLRPTFNTPAEHIVAMKRQATTPDEP